MTTIKRTALQSALLEFDRQKRGNVIVQPVLIPLPEWLDLGRAIGWLPDDEIGEEEEEHLP